MSFWFLLFWFFSRRTRRKGTNVEDECLCLELDHPLLYCTLLNFAFLSLFYFSLSYSFDHKQRLPEEKGGGGNDLHRRFDFVSRFWRRSRRSYFVEDLEDGKVEEGRADW